MNPERPRSHPDDLFDDVFQEDLPASLDQEVLSSARVQLKRRRLRRRVLFSLGPMLVALAGIALLFLGPDRPSSRSQPSLVQGPSQDPVLPPPLTDEELVASFPKGSVILAEVDGVPILVFKSPELKRTYLE